MPALRIKISLFINYFLFAMLLNSAGTLILQVQHYFGTLESDASMIELFKDVSLGLVSFAGFAFISRMGYKNAMLLALGLIATACFVLPSLKTLLAVKLLFAVTGASFALTKISVFGCIGLITKNEKEHISLMNFIEAVFMMGIFVGYFIFSAYLGTGTSSGWFNVYYLLGGLSLLALLMLWTAPLDETAATALRPVGYARQWSVMLRLIVLPMIVAFVLCAFLYVVVEQSIMSWLPTYNNRVLQLSTVSSVQVTSALALSTALGRMAAGVILKRWNWVTVLTGCLTAAALLLLLALVISGHATDRAGGSAVPAVAFVLPLIGFFLAPVYPAINSVVLAALPKSKHGAMSGLIVVFSALGGSVGSISTGFIFQYYGGKTAFFVALVPMLLLVISFFLFEKLRNHRMIMTGMIKTAAAA